MNGRSSLLIPLPVGLTSNDDDDSPGNDAAEADELPILAAPAIQNNIQKGLGIQGSHMG